VAIRGHQAYVACESAGLTIIDISDPSVPALLASHDTEGFALDVALFGDVACIADGPGGLKVVDVSDPASPWRMGTNSDFAVDGVAVTGSLVLAAAGADGLLVYELVPRQITLKALGYSDSGGFRALVAGSAGQQVQLQRSTDLAVWNDWQIVALTDGAVEVSDPSAGNRAQTFYRGVAAGAGAR
jgi:hypothetical protein